MARRPLIQPCDSVSQKADKYQEHGTEIGRLVPEQVQKRLAELAKEEGSK